MILNKKGFGLGETAVLHIVAESANCGFPKRFTRYSMAAGLAE